MLRKIKKFLKFSWIFFKDSENLFLYLMEEKAMECLKECDSLEVSYTEELEDLIFHIRSYLELPEVIVKLKYPELEYKNVSSIIRDYKEHKLTLEEVDMYADFLVELEVQRAVERDIIFEHAKTLSFGFEL
jgi:NTP pyrophosphatase (non-canonical NTP hydrolase)